MSTFNWPNHWIWHCTQDKETKVAGCRQGEREAFSWKRLNEGLENWTTSIDLCSISRVFRDALDAAFVFGFCDEMIKMWWVCIISGPGRHLLQCISGWLCPAWRLGPNESNVSRRIGNHVQWKRPLLQFPKLDTLPLCIFSYVYIFLYIFLYKWVLFIHLSHHDVVFFWWW